MDARQQPPGFEREPYRTELETAVVATGSDAGRPYAVLADTLLYPEGGGQPADRGWLGQVEIVDVQRVEGAIRHYLAAPVEVGPTELRLDWARRHDHMQQHTAQHVLTAVTLGRYGWKTIAFHLGEETCDIELDTPSIAADDLALLEEAVAAEIRAAHPITTRRVSLEEYAAMDVRSRGLPAGHEGDVRLVEIEGIDLNTCGGTHLRSTAEIEALKLLGTGAMRGGTRLYWIAGGRVRRRLGEHERRAEELRRLLDTSNEELVGITAARLEQLRDAGRRQRALEGRLADAAARELAARDAGIVDAHYDDADTGFLQRVARGFTELAPAGAVLLTASGDKGTFFLVAAGPESALDVPAAGGRVAEILVGRGGGSGRIFQGKAGDLSRREEALAALASL